MARAGVAGGGEPGSVAEDGEARARAGGEPGPTVSRRTVPAPQRLLMQVMGIGACCGKAFELAANLLFLLLYVTLGASADTGCTYRRYSPVCTPNPPTTELFLLLSVRILD